MFSGSPDLVREVPLAVLREEVEGQEQGRQRQEEQEAVVEEPTNTKINILQNPNSWEKNVAKLPGIFEFNSIKLNFEFNCNCEEVWWTY